MTEVSAETRRLIERARELGVEASEVVARFCELAREGIKAFDAEVDPLRLDEDKYEVVARSSGLDDLIRSAGSMEDAVNPLSLPAAYHDETQPTARRLQK